MRKIYIPKPRRIKDDNPMKEKIMVLIFGSRSKGNYREGSDIDLAIIGDHIDRVGQVFYEAA